MINALELTLWIRDSKVENQTIDFIVTDGTSRVPPLILLDELHVRHLGTHLLQELFTETNNDENDKPN